MLCFCLPSQAFNFTSSFDSDLVFLSGISAGVSFRETFVASAVVDGSDEFLSINLSLHLQTNRFRNLLSIGRPMRLTDVTPHIQL